MVSNQNCTVRSLLYGKDSVTQIVLVDVSTETRWNWPKAKVPNATLSRVGLDEEDIIDGAMWERRIELSDM